MTIQKCKPSYDEGNTIIKRAPFTQLYNKVLQTCTNMSAIAVWAYLQSQTDDWELNPVQLRKHFKVSKDKIYSILTYMIETNLLVRNVQYAQNHRHIKTTYIVLDGTQFLDAATVSEVNAHQNAPLPDFPEPENREPENQDYKKERGLEKKDDQKDINPSYSATDVAQEREADNFNSFWDIYPIKKNKIRARKIWERKKLNKIAVLIMNDVAKRQVHDSQWQDVQFIPHPSTYLQNELWQDEMSTASPPKTKSTTQSNGDAMSRAVNKYLGGNTYDQHGRTFDPLRG